jgi:two-component system LytT family response regulator
MGKIRTIIVDDEPLARKLLRVLLMDFPDIEVVAECKNGREAVNATMELSPDLLFLDIQMPVMTGFDVIKELQSDVMPMIVFCTAFARYSLEAFDLHAVDYILKPVSEKRLHRAVQRAISRFEAGNEGSENKSTLLGAIDDIAKIVGDRFDYDKTRPSVEKKPAVNSKIAIKDSDTTVLIESDDIDWIDAAGDYMCVHVKGVTHVMRSTLKALTARLDPDKFKRIHRSTVVNLDRIAQITAQDKGEFILDLSCDEKLKVSRNYRDAIKAFISDR